LSAVGYLVAGNTEIALPMPERAQATLSCTLEPGDVHRLTARALLGAGRHPARRSR
jgi:hypothetical protein